MKNQNLLKLVLLPLIAMSISSCGDNGTSSTSDRPNTPNSDDNSIVDSSYSDFEMSQEEDELDLIDQAVLDANVEIDLLIYIEGQRDRLPDIGNYCSDTTDPNYSLYRYHPEDVSSIEMAAFFGAAAAFKKLAPGVKINLQFCSSSDYEQMIQDYRDAKDHVPHIMWATSSCVEMLQRGFNNDLSKYSNTPYFNQYNEYLISRFNFGGFQAGLPIAMDPWGVFVNLDALEDFDIVTETVDKDLGEPTDEYKEWVDNFTWDSFVDAIRKSNNESHAGLSRVSPNFVSYSVGSIYDQYMYDGTVDIASPDMIDTMKKLLEYENEISQYCVYNYNETSYGSNLSKKEYFTNAAPWAGVRNFVEDEYCTFYGEAPWAIDTLSSYISSHNDKVKEDTTGTMKPLNTKIDYLPFPKVDDDAPAYSGVGISGLTFGNLCPVGEDGRKHCASATSELEMDVAAYFGMFMGLDPRAIKSRANLEYVFNGVKYVGDLTMPLCKRGSKFDWQEDDQYSHIEDPAEEFDDNWQYQLSLWFDVYDAYVTNDKPADVVNFSNISYGLLTMLDSVFMIEGIGDDYISCINYNNEPKSIPDGESYKNVFQEWNDRHFVYGDADTAQGVLGTPTYVSNVLSRLFDLEKDINTNATTTWMYLQECIDTYYYDENFESIYNILDRTARNSYEGSKYN